MFNSGSDFLHVAPVFVHFVPKYLLIKRPWLYLPVVNDNFTVHSRFSVDDYTFCFLDVQFNYEFFTFVDYLVTNSWNSSTLLPISTVSSTHRMLLILIQLTEMPLSSLYRTLRRISSAYILYNRGNRMQP